MSYNFYKLLHLVGIILLFAAMGGFAVGADKGGWKKSLRIMHGVALFLLLLAGFGMLARLEITAFPWPGWVFAKFGIWVVLGGAPTAIQKSPEKARPWIALVIVLGVAAAYLAIFKPF